jgi:hypothetical protein
MYMINMPLYEVTNDQFKGISECSLADMKLRERGDLQRLLRTQINVLADDLYVLTEEFGEWEDSRRRIDLLAMDKNANLVVIELKRTNDGGHMELQAIRYASMVSKMTFRRAVEIHAEFLSAIGDESTEAQQRMLEFLGWEEPDEESFAADVRIILVSEDFGKELTTAVLWLREFDIDIACIRLKPYQNGSTRLLYVQQLIPLPEANEYQIQVREKEQQGKIKRAERHDERLRFWQGVIGVARSQKARHANIKAGPYSWLSGSSGIRGLGFNYTVAREHAVIELYIDRGIESENKQIFDKIFAQREAVEKAFGEKLVWDRLDGKRACRIKHIVEDGGYRTAESKWPEIHAKMVKAMTLFETALKPALESLKL